MRFTKKITGDFIANPFWANAETRRATSIFLYPNALGLFLGPLILIFEGWLVGLIKNKTPNTEKVKLFKIIFINLVIILSVVAIIFAKSEGALIGVIAGLVFFFLLFGKKVRIAGIILIIIGSIGILAYEPARDYAINKITLKDLSGEIRKQQWRETLEMLTSSPVKFIFGTGLANYQSSITPYHQEGIFFNKDNDPDFRRKIVIFDDKYRAEHWQPVEIYVYPHNILLNFWTELGLAGMILFIWIVGKFIYLGLRINNANLRMNANTANTNYANNYFVLGLIGAMVVIIVHGIVDVPYFKNDLAVIFWLLIAMMGMMNLSEARFGNLAFKERKKDL